MQRWEAAAAKHAFCCTSLLTCMTAVFTRDAQIRVESNPPARRRSSARLSTFFEKITHGSVIEAFGTRRPSHASSVDSGRSPQHRSTLNEVAELKSCNNVVFFEARNKNSGHDLYMWVVRCPHGPTMKFEVLNVQPTLKTRPLCVCVDCCQEE